MLQYLSQDILILLSEYVNLNNLLDICKKLNQKINRYISNTNFQYNDCISFKLLPMCNSIPKLQSNNCASWRKLIDLRNKPKSIS